MTPPLPPVPLPPRAVASHRVVRVALASRACISLLALMTTWLVIPYDTSARLLSSSSSSSSSSSLGGRLVAPLAASLANWDGVYFTQIATRGYEYEHTHAFFPLYALLVRWLGQALGPVVHPSLAVPLAGWLLSNGCCVAATLYLYRLGCLVLNHERTARRAAYLFCVAPSSIFMTALYSESLMCLLSFAGLFYVETYRRERRFRSLVVAAVLFGGASATRSNGALLSLYIAWYRFLDSPWPLRSPGRFLTHWLATAGLGVLAVGPQLAYFVHGIRLYCPTLVQSIAPALAIPTRITQDRPWCTAVVPNVSAMYLFIQREYWNVGFLRYYEWRQLPNFVLAAPVLLLSAYGLVRFFVVSRRSTRLLPAAATPYFVHWGFLVLNALLVVHIQVTTRLLAACPPLFWAPAAFFYADARAKRSTTAGRVVIVYFLAFYVLGAGLFPSFYPWTNSQGAATNAATPSSKNRAARQSLGFLFAMDGITSPVRRDHGRRPRRLHFLLSPSGADLAAPVAIRLPRTVATLQMASVGPTASGGEKRTSLFVHDTSRSTALASATLVMPNLDGSFLDQRPPTGNKIDEHEPMRLRRVSSEVDRTRPNDGSHYNRSEHSSAVVSSDEQCASLAHLVSAMNPLGMEPRAKTANHDAMVRHFQLRRVSIEASRASYAKDEHEHENCDADQRNAVAIGVDTSLRTLFAVRRLHAAKAVSKNPNDSMRNVNRERPTSEIAVGNGSLSRQWTYWRRRAWRRCRALVRASSVPMSPTGTLAWLRDVVVLVAIVAQLFVAPFVPVYFPVDSHTATALAMVLDVVALVDFLLSFNTAFYDDKTDRLELHRRTIFQRVVRQRRISWIAVDVLLAMPLTVLLPVACGSNRTSEAADPSTSRLLAAEIAWAVARFLRWQSLRSHTTTSACVVRTTTKQLPLRLRLQRYSSMLHAARIVVLFLGVAHYVACLWRAAVKRDDDVEMEAWRDYLEDIATSIELLSGHLPHQPLSRSSHHHTIFSVVSMALGALVMALVTSNIALLLLRGNANASRYEIQLARVVATMDKMPLPPQLQRRIHQYYGHLWVAHDATVTSETVAFANALSPSLALEVHLFKYMDLVLSVPFWRNCSADFITQIMRSLDVRTYLPEDYVMRQDEIGDTLFLINRGVCELLVRARVDQDGTTKLLVPRMRRLHAGAAFGELALLLNYRRTATVRAVTCVEMCILPRTAFQRLLTRYRDDRRDVLREIVVSCIEKRSQRFIPFPYESLLDEAMGGMDRTNAPTPWEAAELLVDLILAPDCVDESIKFGFKDLDSTAQHRLIPTAPPPKSARSSTPTLAPRSPAVDSCGAVGTQELLTRLESMEQWQTDTTKRLTGLEHSMQTMVQELTALNVALAASRPIR